MRIEGASLLPMDVNFTQNNVAAGPELPVAENGTDEFLIGEIELVNAIKTTNNRLEGFDRKAEFSIHEKTGDIMIKVLDTRTNEVVREIPPEKMKDMIANILERAGLLVDERA